MKEMFPALLAKFQIYQPASESPAIVTNDLFLVVIIADGVADSWWRLSEPECRRLSLIHI